MSIKPHLCTDADLTKLRFPLLGMPKIDGVRMLHITGTATGRSLKPHDNPYVTATYSPEVFAGFDGEVTFGPITSESLCRDTTSVLSRQYGEPDVAWNLFDFLRDDVIHLPYIDRLLALHEYMAKAPMMFQEKNISTIPHKMLYTLEDVERFYEQCITLGYEGIILRDPNGLHKSGRATTKLGAYLRMKPQSDKDCIVLRLVEAMENQNEAKVNELGRTERSSHKENKVGKGMVGMLVCKDVLTGIEIDVGAGKMTHAEREYYWNNPDKIVGQYAKYRSMDAGVKDKPRFARFISLRAASDVS